MKKLIVYLILLGNIFADEEIKTKYLSTNINILSGDYASINYGNITTNLEYNMSGRFSSGHNIELPCPHKLDQSQS